MKAIINGKEYDMSDSTINFFKDLEKDGIMIKDNNGYRLSKEFKIKIKT